jgi:Phage phiEco32-like COOH.NH2 ligase-type 2
MAAVEQVVPNRNPNGVVHVDLGTFIGCDPEIFLTDLKGNVVGSERVVPKEGLSSRDKPDERTYYYGAAGSVVRDGVQLELHPVQSSCRANVSNNIQAAMRRLRQELQKPQHAGRFKVSFADVVQVQKKELESLSPESRRLGCMPSLSVYKPPKALLRVNPDTYRKRSGGGHIHMSGGSLPTLLASPEKTRNLVWMLDVFVGNTCVLIDRSPHAAARRRLYGRAGEFRLPSYGIEYRTLSNFWLYAYPLFSLVGALCRMGLTASKNTELYRKGTALSGGFADLEGMVLDSVSMPKVQRAINRNDLDLAKQNFEGLKPLLQKYYAGSTEGIGGYRLPKFEIFAQKIQEYAVSGESKVHGLDFWWKHDPFTHWCDKPEGHGTGWESFLENKVHANSTPATS